MLCDDQCSQATRWCDRKRDRGTTPPQHPNTPVAMSKDTASTDMTLGTYQLDSYVVVSYDGAPYPGLVVDTDNGDVEVKCMHRIGDNRFFWPTRNDVCWYAPEMILAVIPAPQTVTSRHFCIEASTWKMLTE